MSRLQCGPPGCGFAGSHRQGLLEPLFTQRREDAKELEEVAATESLGLRDLVRVLFVRVPSCGLVVTGAPRRTEATNPHEGTRTKPNTRTGSLCILKAMR